ncbi:MAG: glycoside hydrolase family 2 protein [Anaerocolumna sp.]
MIRLFEQHVIRKYKELDGMWDFIKEDDGKKYKLPVPGCWEQNPDMLNYRGIGTYSRKIKLSKDTNLRMVFQGVSHTGDVYFDNQFIAHHYNAFTPFDGIVKAAKKGEHEIKVVVNNTFGEHSSLHIPNDYYTYGGITRPVSIEEIPDTFIKQIHFTPSFLDGKWSAKIEVVVKNIGNISNHIVIGGSLAEVYLEEKTIQVSPEAEETLEWLQEFHDINIVPWSANNPKLYLLEMQLIQDGNLVDDLIERVGFRTVEMRGQKLYLNGEKVFLKGFNRHEDYDIFGCAIPLQLMAQDLDLMQDMGANSVRTCHYPNDERFLDLCDERGILVWEENHARGLLLKDMQNPNFEKQCEDCIREMIELHYNHPSIIIWGILNECASETKEARLMYEKQYKQIKSMDQSRPTTSATCRHFTDICLDLPDIVSFNMYSGWYQDVPVVERHEKEMEWIKNSGGEGKPVIVSEFGAGAIYGYRDRSRAKWSEERQADIIQENIEVYQSDDRLTGMYVWQFADCRVTEEGGWFATRPRSHNNKGVVDEYRRPKMAYDVIKSLFESME